MLKKMAVGDKGAILGRLRSMSEREHTVGTFSRHWRGVDQFCGLGVCLDEIGSGEWVYDSDDGLPHGSSRRGVWWYDVDIASELEETSRAEAELVGLGIPIFVQRNVVQMNDVERCSFAEIADYLDGVL